MTDRLIAFIPAYNEADSIAEVVKRVQPHAHEVIVIDDGSHDNTGNIAAAAGAKILRHEQNRGKGAAINTALDYFAKSDATYAVFLDADGQHPPEEIPNFIAGSRAANATLVVGNRMSDTHDMPRVRKLTNRLTSWLISRTARQPIPDSQCGYRLLHRNVVASLHLGSAHFETETEMLIQAGRAGHKIVSIPIPTVYDPARASRIRPIPDTIRFLKLLWHCRR
jgi:glycosyltransferase involved in cell wall biosynthesis